MSTNPYLFPMDYTSRDYLALREDLINIIKSRIPEWDDSDPADFGVAMVEAFAYMGDVINYYIDRAAAETFLGTASQRKSLLNIASLLGYVPAGRLAASVPVTFTNTSGEEVYLKPGTQITTVIRTGEQNIPLTFEVDWNPDYPSDGRWPISPNGLTAQVTCTEGVTAKRLVGAALEPGKILGTSTGLPNQTFTIRDYPIINRSLSIKVNGVTYDYVQNLYDATPQDKVFTYRTDDLGVTTVIFGDGVSGVIPGEGAEVIGYYRLGGGTIGNIGRGQTFNIVDSVYRSTNDTATNFIGSITNQIQATGGADEESNEQIRASAFAAFRTRNSAVTKQDFEDLAMADNRISKAKARGNSFANMLVYVAPISSGVYKNDPAPGYDAYAVVSKARSGSQVTLTLGESPQFDTATALSISGMGSPFDTTNATRAVTLTDSGDLVTLNGHGMANGSPVVFETIVTTTGITTGTTYYVVNSATNTFQVASTVGGAALPLTGDGSGTLRGVSILSGNNIMYTVGSSATLTTTPTSGVASVGELASFAEIRADIEADLTSKGVVGTIVHVYPPRYRDVAITVEYAVGAKYRRSAAVVALRSSILGWLNYNKVGFNEALRPQEILAQILNTVEEVEYATVTLYDGVGGGSVNLVQAESDQIIRLLEDNLTLTAVEGTGIDA